MRDLNDVLLNGMGWELRLATDINNSGQIVGVGTISGESHAFLLNPSNGGACCLPNGTCLQLATQSLCDAQSGVFHGLGSSCGGDPDGDAIADTCDNCPNTPNPSQANSDPDPLGDACDPCIDPNNSGVCIPTVSQWGLMVMAGLVAAAGGSILRKRRRAAA